MSRWSVVVFAVVTPDLEEALQADLDEAYLALEAMRSESPVHVHVNIVRPADGKFEMWPPSGTANALSDAKASDKLTNVLASAKCWQDDGEFDSTGELDDDGKPFGRHGRLLVLWGHGARAFAEREAAASSVPDGAEVATAFATKKIRPPDIVGYDACQMATVSTIRALAEAFPAAVFIGSMVPEPASGWPYFQLLGILDQPRTPKAVAAAVVEAYAGSVSVPDWCMVAISLAEVAKKRTGLTASIHRLMATKAPARITFFAAADGADIREDTNVADLGALMRRLVAQGPNRRAAAVSDAIRACRVTRRAAGRLAGRDGIGVRIGLPWGKGDPADPDWPDPPQKPGWLDYLPDV
jgi:hypothetical protein